MVRSLSGSTLIINDETVSYKSGTLEIELGDAEASMMSQVSGDGKTEYVYTQDFDTQKGRVTFELVSIDKNLKIFKSWKTNAEENLVKVISPAGVSYQFQEAAVVGVGKASLSNDGTIEVEFESQPAVIG